jgi:surfactin synthase thioesterase subunit
MTDINLIAIPFAGGSEYSYERFNRFLPPNISLRTVGFPGRGERLEENNKANIRLLALDVLDQIEVEIQSCEYIIYGHSMGALVGYELAKEILMRKYPAPSCLFFTGRAAPSIPEKHHISTYSNDAFWREVSSYGGIPEEVLATDELLEFFEPMLRSDFKAVELYEYRPMAEPLKIPIYAIAGTQETDISDNDLNAWQKETAFPIYHERMSGDHFFIFEHAQKLIQQIVSAHKMYL